MSTTTFYPIVSTRYMERALHGHGLMGFRD